MVILSFRLLACRNLVGPSRGIIAHKGGQGALTLLESFKNNFLIFLVLWCWKGIFP